MSEFSAFTLCIFIYSFLFLLSYAAPSYKNVSFGIVCNPQAKAVLKEIKAFRIFFSDISIYFFIFSVIFLFFTSELVFLTFFITLYLFILIFKFYKSNSNLKETVQINAEDKEKSDCFIRIKAHHYSLHLFTVLYIIFISLREKSLNPDFFTDIYTVNSLTAIFILSLLPLAYIFLKYAPEFARKRVKQLIYNYIYLFSFTLLFVLYSYTSIIMHPDFIFAFYTLFYLLILIFLCVVFYLYIKRENKPYPFKAERCKITSGRLIESTLDGRKLFLNFKNKKAILITSGMALYVMIYLLAVYLLTI